MPENLHIDEETPQMKTPESEAIGELRRIVEEQKAVLVKQAEQLAELNKRVADSETVRYSAPPNNTPPAVPKIDPQEAAYIAMLKDMGIEEKKD